MRLTTIAACLTLLLAFAIAIGCDQSPISLGSWFDMAKTDLEVAPDLGASPDLGTPPDL